MAPSRTPCRNVNQPMTMSASPKVQPATVGRTRKTTKRGTIAVAIQKTSMKPSSRKSARYCIARRSDARSCMPRRRRYRIASTAVGREPAQPAPPEDGRRRERDRRPSTHCRASSASGLGDAVRAGHELDRAGRSGSGTGASRRRRADAGGKRSTGKRYPLRMKKKTSQASISFMLLSKKNAAQPTAKLTKSVSEPRARRPTTTQSAPDGRVVRQRAATRRRRAR